VQLLRRAEHADRYLATIGDEDFVEHWFVWRGFEGVQSATLTAAGNGYE
jgi:hypothetical protein